MAASSAFHLSRSSRGYKILDANGRTLARFDGRLARRRASRHLCELERRRDA